MRVHFISMGAVLCGGVPTCIARTTNMIYNVVSAYGIYSWRKANKK